MYHVPPTVCFSTYCTMHMHSPIPSLSSFHALSPFDLVDVNECSIYGTCSQLCYNTRGSFTCKCVAGYEMVDHPTMGSICKPIGEFPTVFDCELVLLCTCTCLCTAIFMQYALIDIRMYIAVKRPMWLGADMSNCERITSQELNNN